MLVRAARRSLGPGGWFAAVLVTLGLGALWWWVPPPNQHLFGGYPQAQNWLNRVTAHVLANPGFTLAYSEWHGGPAWVAYRVARVEEPGGVGRLDHFSLDHRTLRRISSDDYRNSGYDRGHLAPNYAMAKLDKSWPRWGDLKLFEMSKLVEDDIPDQLLQWEPSQSLDGGTLTQVIHFPRAGESV